ncbi:MAG: ABC transporter substrate-binding protein [Candidatus Woesearchaeota archaeon]
MRKVSVFLMLFLVACVQVAEEKTKVGVILPLTGPFAFYGEDGRIAMELALEDVGDKIEIIYEDSGGENTKAVAAFNKIVNVDGAKVVITSTSWISNAVYSQAADANIFQGIIASAAFKRTREDKAVRFTVDVADEAQYIIDYLEQFNRIAILHLDNDYGKGWAEELKQKLSDKVVAVEKYAPTDIDVSVQLSKIKAVNPDVLVLASTAKEGGLFARKSKELGIDAQLVSMRPIQNPQLFEETEAVEGLVYSYPKHNQNHSFISRYIAKYGKEPTVFAVEAYDAVIEIARAAEKCNADTKCMHQSFVNNEYYGALGHVKFDAKGDAHYPFVLKQVRDGKFVLFEK